IKYDLPKEANVKINIYNARGAKIDQLVNGTISAGYHKVNFDASRFSNGLYYYTLEVNNKVKAVKKMLYLK
ncbi:MAG: T9SS type A sorting domain-containing protein, partial [Candidatus Delongbacteria bacterium]|nr:T9SS type A sorting domain-containing protein [Candidatus Delongbacteria bacterium]